MPFPIVKNKQSYLGLELECAIFISHDDIHYAKCTSTFLIYNFKQSSNESFLAPLKCANFPRSLHICEDSPRSHLVYENSPKLLLKCEDSPKLHLHMKIPQGHYTYVKIPQGHIWYVKIP